MVGTKRKSPPINDNVEEVDKLEQVLKKLKMNPLSNGLLPFHSFFTRKIIVGDGNCLFRAILYSLTGNDSDHLSLREQICEYVVENQAKYKGYHVGYERGLLAEMEKMKKEKTWGTGLELYAASEMLQFNFKVFYENSFDLYCSCIHSIELPTIYLEYQNGNHFNSLNLKEERSFGKQNDKESFQDLLESCDQKGKRRFQTLKNLEILKEQLKIKTTKIDLSKTNLAHRRIYPLAKSNKDTYNEVFNFLFHKTVPQRFLPLLLHQKKFNNWKKDIGKLYSLDRVSTNPNTLSRLRFARSNEDEVIIPYQDEIAKIIEMHHTGFSESKKHFGHKITTQNISQSELYWAKMSLDVHNYIVSCPSCVETKHEKPIKERKAIIPKKPLERIQADLIELNADQSKASGSRYKFVLSCVDHFSKYKWCYALDNKSAEKILQCIKNVFATYGPPTIFQTDNGKEFKNNCLISYLKTNKIKFVNGSVRHPQSQGLVERHNRELKDYLEKSFRAFQIDNKNDQEWNLLLEIENFRVRENNRFHTVTKYKPNEIILSKDKNLLEKVKVNIENYLQKEAQKHNEMILETLRKGTKVFIVKNVIPNRNHTRLDIAPGNKFSAKVRTKIPAIILKDYKQRDNAVSIQIAACQSNLKLKNTYRIYSNLLSLPDDYSWNLRVTTLEKP